MIENVSTQLTVFHCFAHCLLPGRAFASLYALLFLEKEAEIGGLVYCMDMKVCDISSSDTTIDLIIKVYHSNFLFLFHSIIFYIS